MAKKMELVTEEFCGWPYFQPYTFLRAIPRKPRVKKITTAKPKKRKAKTCLTPTPVTY